MQATCNTVLKNNSYTTELEQQNAISFFEEEIKQYIQMGAGTRAKAIDWIFDANIEIQQDEDDYDELFDECDRFIGKIENDKNEKYELLEQQYKLPKGYISTVNHLLPFNSK